MTSTRSFLLLFVEAILLHYFLILALTSQQVNGFFLQHPSYSPMKPNSYGERTRSLENKHGFLLKSSASSVILPETNSSFKMNDEPNVFEDTEGETTRSYPWSEVQQWTLRDNVPKYIIRIPIKQKTLLTSTKSQEDTVLSSFALWKSLQNDVPELAGYPIDFLQARYEEILRGEQKKNDDSDDNGTIKSAEPPTAPGVLPYLQDYEFSSGGGICGYVYGMDGVSDGSRIETSVVRDVKESLPRGYIQTSDFYASFELGNPLLQSDVQVEKGIVANASPLKDVSNIVTMEQMRSALNDIDDGDGMLLRLGALSGIVLAGATGLSMLSHHLTVNVFWV